ncbi:MAG: hypothetical protein Q9227_003646 [Pyrenula ochraceoflavens]
MMLLYSNLTGPQRNDKEGPINEYDRAAGLCDWIQESDLGGSGWGLEGIVRMNAGFELIWCNFSSPSLRLIDHINVTAPLLPQEARNGITRGSAIITAEEPFMTPMGSITPLPLPTTLLNQRTAPAYPPNPYEWRKHREQEPYLNSQAYEWLRSATWHYGHSGSNSGESRVKLLTCGFMTFYDPTFEHLSQAKTKIERERLNLTELGTINLSSSDTDQDHILKSLSRRRRYHTLTSMPATEAAAFRAKAKRVLTNLNSPQTLHHSSSSSSPQPHCTGTDWYALTTTIVTRYSAPLLELSHLLSTPPNTNSSTSALILRTILHALLTPFFSYPSPSPSSSPPSSNPWSLDGQLAQETLSRCTFHYTRLHHSHPLNPEESLLRSSVEDVMRAICSTAISIFFPIERHFSTSASSPSSSQIRIWANQLRLLRAWLGWQDLDLDVQCEENCGVGQLCYVPMWPLQLPLRHGHGQYGVTGEEGEEGGKKGGERGVGKQEKRGREACR